MLVSVTTRGERRFELASPSPQDAEHTPKLTFSLSTLEEQLEPQFAVGLVTRVATDTGGNSSLVVDSTALIRNSRPLSGDFNVHCENSRVASFMSRVAGLVLRSFSTLHQSQTQLPVSRPSFEAEQYLQKVIMEYLVSPDSRHPNQVSNNNIQVQSYCDLKVKAD